MLAVETSFYAKFQVCVIEMGYECNYSHREVVIAWAYGPPASSRHV